MSAETLRRAAALMRERATVATPGPWESGTDGWVETISGDGEDWCYVRQVGFISDITAQMLHGDDGMDGQAEKDAEHIASWNPAVAVAVATLLDSHADIHALRTCDERLVVPCPALAVARAYLAEQS